MTTASRTSPPVARLATPGEVAAAVPLLCGFVPTQSLVLVCLRGPRRRLGLTLRVDLPAAGAPGCLAADLAGRVAHADADEVVAVVWTDDSGPRPHAALVQAVDDLLDEVGVHLRDALLVRDGRWWSYTCRDSVCCPPEGTPVAGSPAVDLVAAHAVLDGRAVLPSREALAASLVAPTGAAAAAAAACLVSAGNARGRRLAGTGRVRAGREALARWRHALQQRPDDETAAALVVALRDLVVRDEVLTWLLDDDEALFGLLLDLARRTPPPDDAAVCALLAWVAHSRGDGALANVALDRALATDPGCSLAQVARAALDRQMPPADVRTLLEHSRAALRAQQPWTAAR